MRTVPLSVARIGAVILLSVACAEAGNRVPERDLADADARFPEAFGLVSTVRELGDGRVLIADPLGQALMVVDMTSGTADTIGRVGPGPGEYRQPDLVLPLPGDSTLIADLGNGRLVVLGPDLSFGETFPIAQGEPSGPGLGGMNIILPRATDSRGRVYFQALGMMMRPGGQLPDSGAVMRWDRSTGAIETVARVKLQERTVETSGSGRNQNVRLRQIPLSPEDAWAVSWDGRVAAARSGGYYLEWTEPERGTVRGDDVIYEPVPIGRGEQEAYLDRAAATGLSISADITNGVQQMSFGRGGGRGGDPDVNDYDWPDVMPAFASNGVRVTPEGDAWVRRSTSAGDPPVYDVFGEDGQLKERVLLPRGREVVGFGLEHVYAAQRDEFDLIWLERYKRTT
jgi:hypothetical protein